MSIKQSFLFNTLFTLCVNFIVKPLWVFGIDRTVQNELGSHDYGLYFAIYNYTYLFQIILDFGLQNYNQTEIAFDNSKFGKLLPGMLTAKGLLTILYILLTILIGYGLGYADHAFFPWLILNQIILSFNIFLRSNISGHRLFIKDAFLSILDKVLMILGCSFMLIPAIQFIPLSIENFVWIQTIALSITSVFCIYYNLKLSSSFNWRFDFPLFKKIILQAFPFAMIYFLMTVFYRIDTVMIEQMLDTNGAEEAGIYAQSYRIMESVNNIGYIVAGLLLPLFSYQLGKKESVQQILKQGYSLLLTIIVPIVIGGIFFSKEIIQTLYPDENPTYSSGIFIILLLNFIPVGFQYVLGPLLTAKRSFRIMLPSLAAASILNIILNYTLIPKYGAWGAAAATFSTQIFMLMIYWIATFIIFKISVWGKLLFRTIGYIFIVGLLTYGVAQLSIFWLFSLMIVGSTSLILSVVLQIINKETLSLKIH